MWHSFTEIQYCAVLCCAVLCCAVLCCAVLCCAVLCCAVLCCAVLYCISGTIGLIYSQNKMVYDPFSVTGMRHQNNISMTSDVNYNNIFSSS